MVQGRPWERLSVSGQFLYSQPSIEVNYQEEAAGDLFALRALTPFTNQLGSSLADANRPHSSGSWSTEVRPIGRLRVVQSWYTDRFHISAGAFSSQMRNTGREGETELQAVDLLVLNYNQHQLDVIYDVGDRVTLRGGHSYVWGDAPGAGFDVATAGRSQCKREDTHLTASDTCHKSLHTSQERDTITQECSVCHELVALEEEAPAILTELGLY